MGEVNPEYSKVYLTFDEMLLSPVVLFDVLQPHHKRILDLYVYIIKSRPGDHVWGLRPDFETPRQTAKRKKQRETVSEIYLLFRRSPN